MYDRYEKALARVEHLKATQGCWPGIIKLRCQHKGCRTKRCRHFDEQRWTLTYDPGDRLHT